MENSVYSKGDKVRHKAEPKFDMVIISNGRFKTTDKVLKSNWGNINPKSYICKYYNSDTSKWEEEFFYEEELELFK